ncbi:hypothetical protein GW17_00029790 [Ensete ventricosum]|nr:hypothetical protein GW17_00029790 [Ensete ventricosum]RZS21552.1 hypothetical protein BHM03_00054206 [Ensete ventricosum]
MPSVLRQAIGAIKDQASISIAKFSKRSANLEVAVLKVTSHDEVPIEERHLTEVLLRSASCPSSAKTCVRILSRRISRTSNWVVALKTLVVVFRLLRSGGSQFIHKSLAAPQGSRRLLDLSRFRDYSATSSPWDYTAFVRTFAVYLDARLHSALLGKLSNLRSRRPIVAANLFANMKTPLILEHIEHWQRLLHRAMGTRPTGPAQANRLIQIALYMVVCETFSLYHDISHGLSLLLDNFFHLQPESRLKTFQACMKARKQFEDLESFHDFCRKIGVGRMSEYPRVQQISGILLRASEEFLKNRPSSLATSPNTKPKSVPPLNPITLEQEQEDTTTARRPSTTSERESVASHHKDWQLQPISSSVNIKNGESYVAKNLLLVDDHQHTDTDSDGWEILLVRSLNDMSKEASVIDPPAQSLLNWRVADRAEDLQNPFLINHDNRSRVLIPAPTFCAGKPNAEQAYQEMDPFNDAATGAYSSRSDGLMRQQRVLREQQMWMQQQSKIMAKRLAR